MPRIAINRKEYMIADLPYWLVKEAKKKGLYQKDLAKELGITPQAFHDRLKKGENGKPKDVFSYGELLTLFKKLGLSDEEILRLMRL